MNSRSRGGRRHLSESTLSLGWFGFPVLSIACPCSLGHSFALRPTPSSRARQRGGLLLPLTRPCGFRFLPHRSRDRPPPWGSLPKSRPWLWERLRSLSEVPRETSGADQRRTFLLCTRTAPLSLDFSAKMPKSAPQIRKPRSPSC